MVAVDHGVLFELLKKDAEGTPHMQDAQRSLSGGREKAEASPRTHNGRTSNAKDAQWTHDGGTADAMQKWTDVPPGRSEVAEGSPKGR